MPAKNDTVRIQVNIDIPTAALTTIVARAKNAAGVNAKGHYVVDTADAVSEMISRFLIDRNFGEYVASPQNDQPMPTGDSSASER